MGHGTTKRVNDGCNMQGVIVDYKKHYEYLKSRGVKPSKGFIKAYMERLSATDEEIAHLDALLKARGEL